MKYLAQKPWFSRNLAGFSLASLFSDSSHEMVPLLLPSLVVHLVGAVAAPQYLGIISGVSGAVASITVLFAGWLSDVLPQRKTLLLVGYFFSGLLVGMLGFATSWITVLFLVTFAWFGRGLVSAPRNALIADSVAPAYYGHAFGFRQAADTIGAIIGPIIVYLGASWSVEKLFLSTLIPGTLAFLAIVLLVKEVPRKKAASTSALVSFEELPTNFYFFCAIMLIFGMGNFNRTLLLLHLQNTLPGTMSTKAILSLLTALYILRNIVQAFADYLMGSVSDTIGRKIPMAFGCFLFGLMSLLLIWPSTSMLYLIAVFALSGFSAGTYTTTEKSFAADLLKEKRGTGYGLLLTVDSIGDLLSSIIVGFLWTTYSPQVGFIYAAVMSFIAACLIFFLPRTSFSSYFQKGNS